MKKKRQILAVLFLIFSNLITAQNWNQIINLTGSDIAPNDHLGNSVSISGNYAIVGTYNKDNYAGAAYIFYNNNGTWEEVQKIVASDREKDDNFGNSVAIDGNYAVIGASYEDENTSGLDSLYSAGAAYIFYNNNGTWEEVQKIVASDREKDDNFGNSVAIADNYIFIGAYHEDENASGVDSSRNAGSVYIFYKNKSGWEETQKIVASDRSSGDNFGSSVSINKTLNGSTRYAIIGATQGGELGGAAYLFKENDGTWEETQKIIASDDTSFTLFGASVSISGDYTIIGAYLENRDTAGNNILTNAGAAYIFEYNTKYIPPQWEEVQKIVASDREKEDYFGSSVAISNNYIIVGAYKEDENVSNSDSLLDTGSAYIFHNNNNYWEEIQKITLSYRAAGDFFGKAVSISGDYIVVGLPNYDYNNPNTGSATIFGNMDNLPVELTTFSANVENNIVKLNWQTATEVNNYGFNVERSSLSASPVKTWDKIGFVEGHGNSNTPNHYLFTDDNVNSGKYLYRLKQIDIDGSFEYSKSIEVEIGTPTKFELAQNFPNPFNPTTTIKYSLPMIGNNKLLLQNVTLKVYDVLGNEVATLVNQKQEAGRYEVQFNASNLSSGIYYYRLQTGNFVQTKKLVLMK